MKSRPLSRLFAAIVLLAVSTAVWAQTGASDPQSDPAAHGAEADDAAGIAVVAPPSIDEARSRAKILHEMFHGSLQVMHRDFFRADQALKIPSHALEDVFSELKRGYGIELRWIAVDTKAMNIDNEPKAAFEREAVEALKAGEDSFESITDDRYHFVGRIRLSTVCLSCHLSRRSDNQDRAAGLVITMPLASDGAE